MDASEVKMCCKHLALIAVRHLERAVSCSDSSYVGTYAQWLSTGDQDLNPLRATYEFIDFLDRYLPNDQPRAPRPKDLLQLIMSMHTMRLLQQYANLRANYWEGELRPDADELAIRDELEREAAVRNKARNFALDDRDWRTRLELINETDDFVRRRRLRACSSALPQFQDDPAVSLYVLGKALVDGGKLDYPDAYYETVSDKRDHRWQAVLKLLPEQVASDAMGRNKRIPRYSAMQFWRAVDVTLTGALDERTWAERRANTPTFAR